MPTTPIRRRLAVGALAGLLAAFASGSRAQEPATTPDPHPARILYVDSYQPGYPWSDGIREGFLSTLHLVQNPDGLFVSRDRRLQVRTFDLDAKRHPEQEWQTAAVARARQLVDSWQPNLLVACDDNAARDLVVPYFRDTDLPVIFCGVNWDASVYGFPCRNVTGIVEVSQVPELVAELKRHARGDRGGLLVLDTLTGRREAAIYQERFGLDLEVVFVHNSTEWLESFVRMQDEVDYLMVMQNITGVDGWNQDEAVRVTNAFTRVPTGTVTEGMISCVVVSIVKVPQELGTWAAQTAQEILAGRPVADIPVVTNKESRVYLNMSLARKLGIIFSMDLIDRATFVEERLRP